MQTKGDVDSNHLRFQGDYCSYQLYQIIVSIGYYRRDHAAIILTHIPAIKVRSN